MSIKFAQIREACYKQIMDKLQPIRGMKDLFLADAAAQQHIINTCYNVAAKYNFHHAVTPILEKTAVFSRTLGDSSDVVNKEMYSFEDKSGDNVTLRPEFTASIARAFISEGLQQNVPLKCISNGPLFRYERPQKGRQRQFHQINCEWLGTAGPMADIEMIQMAWDMLNALGINHVELQLNTLGDAATRQAHKAALVDYFERFKQDLSADSQTRLQHNPLRILDSKDAKDQDIAKEAPLLLDYLTNEAALFWNQLQATLHDLNIPHTHNHQIVRGLDYYTHTVFEFVGKSDDLGSQNTLLAGGRYDELIQQMGGPPTPAIGFAMGIERLALMLNECAIKAPHAVIIPIGDTMTACLKLATKLRAATQHVELIHGGGNLGKKLKKADKLNAEYAYIMGEDELANNHVIKRHLATGAQEEITL